MRTNKPFRCAKKSEEVYEVFSLRTNMRLELNPESKLFFDYLNTQETFQKQIIINEYSRIQSIEKDELNEFIDYLICNEFIVGE